jgi:hypothetical protein
MALSTQVNGNKVTVSTSTGQALRTDQAADTNNPIESLTLAQALTYIDNNVVDLASARVALKHLCKIVFVLRADYNRTVKK